MDIHFDILRKKQLEVKYLVQKTDIPSKWGHNLESVFNDIEWSSADAINEENSKRH